MEFSEGTGQHSALPKGVLVSEKSLLFCLPQLERKILEYNRYWLKGQRNFLESLDTAQIKRTSNSKIPKIVCDLYWAMQSAKRSIPLFFFFSGSDSLTLVDKNEEVEGGNKEAGRKGSNMIAGTGGHLINLYCDNRAKVKKVKDLLMVTNLCGKQKVCSRMSAQLCGH